MYNKAKQFVNLAKIREKHVRMTRTNSNWVTRVGRFYLEGFRGMTLGKTLWAVILVKLFIIFAILKVFFFPDFIGRNAEEGEEADYVSEQIIDRAYD